MTMDRTERVWVDTFFEPIHVVYDGVDSMPI